VTQLELESPIVIPVRRRGNIVVASAKVDAADAALARFRWSFDQDGYVVASPHRGMKLRLHRLILGLGPGDGLEADHINGDKLDNRRGNLRVASRAQNGQNVPARRGASRHRNVYYDPSRPTARCWRARYGGVKGRHIGWFLTEEEAAAAAEAWRRANVSFAVSERAIA
jgi:hypothetical protein